MRIRPARGSRPSARGRRRGLFAVGRGLRAVLRVVGAQPATWVVAAVVGFIALGTSGTVYAVDGLGWGLVIGAIVGLPFALAVTRPVTGLLVSVAAAVALTQLPLVDRDPWPWLVVHGLVMLALLFAVCVRENVPTAISAWIVTLVLFLWGVTDDVATGWGVGVTVVAVVGLLVGRLLSTNRALARQEELSSAEKARRVVLEERARIARDLHDIVAHHMSLIVVQTETAAYRVPDLSEAGRAELLSVGETARSALAETRALLAVLRHEGQEPVDAPQPGADRVPDLVGIARRAGTAIETRVDGSLDVLAPGSSLAVYRVAQEALANAARHAPSAPVTLELLGGPEGVRLRVRNALPAGAGPEGTRPGETPVTMVPGHGITGMRERAVAAGGQLRVGPDGDGWFTVDLFVPAVAESGA